MQHMPGVMLSRLQQRRAHDTIPSMTITCIILVRFDGPLLFCGFLLANLFITFQI